MKRQLRRVFTMTLILILTALWANIPTYAAGPPAFLYPRDIADVDNDSQYTAIDARMALRISAKIEKNTTEHNRLASDYDGDGEVTASDARSILRLSAMLEKHPYNAAAFKQAAELYVQIMNTAKKEKPGFSVIYYMSAPSDTKNHKVIAEGVSAEDLEFLSGLFPKMDDMDITREQALADKMVVNKGSNMAEFPLFGRGEGALSLDPSLFRVASVTTLANGNKRIVLTLNDELNPSLTPTGGSFTSAIFYPLSLDDFEQNDDITGDPDFEITLSMRNFGCTATLEYNPTTKRVVSLKHNINAEMRTSTNILGSPIHFVQNLYSTYEWLNFSY